MLLAHFGEQAGAHAAVEDIDCADRVVVIGMAERHAVVADADLRLCRFLADVRITALSLADGQGWIGTLFPVPKELANLIPECLPVDVASDGENGPVGAEQFSIVSA